MEIKGRSQSVVIGVLVGALGCSTTYRLTPRLELDMRTRGCIERCRVRAEGKTESVVDGRCAQSCPIEWQRVEGKCHNTDRVDSDICFEETRSSQTSPASKALIFLGAIAVATASFVYFVEYSDAFATN